MKSRFSWSLMAFVVLNSTLTLFGRPLSWTTSLVSSGCGRKSIRCAGLSFDRPVVMDGTLRRIGGETVRALRPLSASELHFDVTNCGFYALEVSWLANGSKVYVTNTTFAVPPVVHDAPRELGVCTHFAQGKGRWPETFDLITQLGATRVRDDLTWSAVERKRRDYAMPCWASEYVAHCEERGLKPLFVFGYPNRAAYPDAFGQKPFPTDDVTRIACAEALAWSARYFGARVREWELWNEPNCAHPVKDYLPLLKAAYLRFKAASPRSILISGGGSGAGGGPGGAFIDPLLKAGGRNFQDGWSIHPYMSPHDPDLGYACSGGSPIPAVSIPIFVPYLLNLARPKVRGENGLSLWVTEIGWPIGQVSEMEQAAYAVRTYLLSRKHGLATGVYWYDFQDDGNDPKEKEFNFGLVRQDFSPKPAFQALAVFSALFGNLLPVSGSVWENGVSSLACGRGMEYVEAAWTADGRERLVQIPPGCIALDWQGCRINDVAVRSREIHVGALPCYFIRQKRQ